MTDMFDKQIARRLVAAVQNILIDHPELRTVGIALAYEPRLDAADLDRLLWIGRGPLGAVERHDDVFTSMLSTMKLLQAQQDRLLAGVAALKEQVEVLGSEVATRRLHERTATDVPAAS